MKVAIVSQVEIVSISSSTQEPQTKQGSNILYPIILFHGTPENNYKHDDLF